MIKIILLISIFILSYQMGVCQQNTFKLGDEVEYFDGINWVDSKILNVSSDGKYLVYLNHDMSKTKWFSSEDVKLLYQETGIIVEKKTITETKTVYFKVGDIVYYTKNGKTIQSEILNINTTNFTYLIYSDESKSTVQWVNENELNKQLSDITEKKETITYTNLISFVRGDKIKLKSGNDWIDYEIIDVRDGKFQVFADKEQSSTKWVEYSEIKKP